MIVRFTFILQTLVIPQQILVLSDFCQIRYNHDGSETVEDHIEFTATDGSNSVHFVLQVKVT